MNFHKFTISSNQDPNILMEFEIDLDTIDDDEVTINLTQETLSTDENGELDEVSKQLNEAYENDDLFLQCCWDIHDAQLGYKIDRVTYTIKNGGWTSYTYNIDFQIQTIQRELKEVLKMYKTEEISTEIGKEFYKELQDNLGKLQKIVDKKI